MPYVYQSDKCAEDRDSSYYPSLTCDDRNCEACEGSEYEHCGNADIQESVMSCGLPKDHDGQHECVTRW